MLRFKEAADKNNLEISALVCHGNPLHPQKSFSEDHIEDLKKTIELASKLQVKTITRSGGFDGIEMAAFPPHLEANTKENREAVKKLLKKNGLGVSGLAAPFPNFVIILLIIETIS